MKKKILSLVLALLMAASSAAMVSADEAVTLAASENATHVASAEFLQSQEIMKGKEDGNLDLGANIKRYEMALFVSRISTGWTDDAKWGTAGVNNTGFTDLEGSGAINVMGAISYANQKGIIEGYGNGEFGPEDGITYQDALTMVVRTLGWKDLGWPWDYIEKAIDLGLTANVTEKSYTEVLNRGEVAQLIYNTLKTVNKAGETLAFTKFQMKEATIVITASDRVVYESGAAYAPAGKVAFKTYDLATGALGSKTYYAAASEFAFEGHDDDLAVGTLYKALLSTDKAGNIAAVNGKIIKSFEASEKTTFVNADGEVQIKNAVKDLKLASKYERAAGETLVFNALTKAVATTTIGGIAMDWATGDILQEVAEADGYSVVVNGKFYKVAWYYNATLNKYFRYKTDAATGGVVGFEWLEDNSALKAEIEALKATNKVNTDATIITKFTQAQAEAPYAELELEKFAENATYLQGVYEEFGLGYIQKVAKVKCAECNKEYAGYKISNVVDKMVAPNAGELSVGNGTFIDFENGTTYDLCEKHGAWLSELEVTADEAFVIYAFNAATKELKIVKELEKQYGVLRAYSVNKAKVLIGENMIDLGYKTLLGAGFKDVAKNAANYLDGLDALLNTYVEYVIVDNKVVSIRAAKQAVDADRYLIMQDFVGVTSDGYIVVEAYSTTTGALSRYLVNSYNGFKKNSYYYYTTKDAAAAAFATGSLYYVSNANGIYIDIEKFGGYVDGVFTVDESKVALTEKSYAFTVDGYKIVDGKAGDKDLKANEGNYIIVAPYYVPGLAPIYVYSGEVFDTNWAISGKILKSVTGADVFVVVDDMAGFALDAHEHGMYMYNGGKVYEAAYDRDAYNTFFGEDASLILPTDTYMVVEVVDLYTGKVTTKSLRNISKDELHDNAVYVTVGNNVIYTLNKDVNFVDYMAFAKADRYVDVYGRDARTSADYLFGTFEYTLIKNQKLNASFVQSRLISDGYYSSARFFKVDAKKLEQYVVTYDAAGNAILNDLATFANENAGVVVECVYIYNPKNDTTVVYGFVATEAPETQAPETQAPETQAPETQAPETQAPETQAPETQAPETQAPETQAPETQAPETNAPEAAPETVAVAYDIAIAGDAATVAAVDAKVSAGDEVVFTVAINSDAAVVANSYSFAYITYDDTVLEFKGYANPGSALLASFFGESGIDKTKNTIVIGLMAPQALSGGVCDLVFAVKEGAALGETKLGMEVQVKNNATVLLKNNVELAIVVE